MQNIAWGAAASYNGRFSTLEDCVRAWKRDAQRGCGALGTISTAHVVMLNGMPMPAQDLSVRECWDLAETLRGAHRARAHRLPASASEKPAALASRA